MHDGPLTTAKDMPVRDQYQPNINLGLGLSVCIDYDYTGMKPDYAAMHLDNRDGSHGDRVKAHLRSHVYIFLTAWEGNMIPE